MANGFLQFENPTVAKLFTPKSIEAYLSLSFNLGSCIS